MSKFDDSNNWVGNELSDFKSNLNVLFSKIVTNSTILICLKLSVENRLLKMSWLESFNIKFDTTDFEKNDSVVSVSECLLVVVNLRFIELVSSVLVVSVVWMIGKELVKLLVESKDLVVVFSTFVVWIGILIKQVELIVVPFVRLIKAITFNSSLFIDDV